MGNLNHSAEIREVQMPKDLTVHLEDTPGTLAEIGEILGEAGINIDGICGMTCEGLGVLHLLVEDSQRARMVLEAAGKEVLEENEVFLVDIVDRPGELGGIARRLAVAGVNLHLLYLTANMDLVIGVDDLDKASTVL
jgi:hypothetical protein